MAENEIKETNENQASNFSGDGLSLNEQTDDSRELATNKTNPENKLGLESTRDEQVFSKGDIGTTDKDNNLLLQTEIDNDDKEEHDQHIQEISGEHQPEKACGDEDNATSLTPNLENIHCETSETISCSDSKNIFQNRTSSCNSNVSPDSSDNQHDINDKRSFQQKDRHNKNETESEDSPIVETIKPVKAALSEDSIEKESAKKVSDDQNNFADSKSEETEKQSNSSNTSLDSVEFDQPQNQTSTSFSNEIYLQDHLNGNSTADDVFDLEIGEVGEKQSDAEKSFSDEKKDLKDVETATVETEISQLKKAKPEEQKPSEKRKSSAANMDSLQKKTQKETTQTKDMDGSKNTSASTKKKISSTEIEPDACSFTTESSVDDDFTTTDNFHSSVFETIKVGEAEIEVTAPTWIDPKIQQEQKSKASNLHVDWV